MVEQLALTTESHLARQLSTSRSFDVLLLSTRIPPIYCELLGTRAVHRHSVRHTGLRHSSHGIPAHSSPSTDDLLKQEESDLLTAR